MRPTKPLPASGPLDQVSSSHGRTPKYAHLLRGIAAAALIALVALALGQVIPLAGAPVLALVFGIAIATVRQPAAALRPGLAWSGKYVLQTAIVALGATLSLSNVASVGLRTLPVMLGTLAAALLVAVVAGRALGVSTRLRTLVGVGTGICGASAIAAVSGVIAASEAEIAYAVSTIFVFNLVAVLAFPAIGHLLGLSQSGFGLWAGTAVNDTSSVVATAYAYGKPAGAYAVIVKLVRTTMIVPVVGVLAISARSHGQGGPGIRWAAIIPWFLVWFAAAAALASVGLIPATWHAALAQAAVVLITVALAAIGLSTRVGDLRRAGHRPLLLGTLVWIAVAATGLVLQSLMGAS